MNASAPFFSPLISHLFRTVEKKKKFENRVKGLSSRVGSSHGQITLVSHYGMQCVIQFSGPFHFTSWQRTCSGPPLPLKQPPSPFACILINTSYLQNIVIPCIYLNCHWNVTVKEKLYQNQLWSNSDLAFWGCFLLQTTSSIWVKCHITIYMCQPGCAWTYTGGWYLFSSFNYLFILCQSTKITPCSEMPFLSKGTGQPPESSQMMHGIIPRH